MAPPCPPKLQRCDLVAAATPSLRRFSIRPWTNGFRNDCSVREHWRHLSPSKQLRLLPHQATRPLREEVTSSFRCLSLAVADRSTLPFRWSFMWTSENFLGSPTKSILHDYNKCFFSTSRRPTQQENEDVTQRGNDGDDYSAIDASDLDAVNAEFAGRVVVRRRSDSDGDFWGVFAQRHFGRGTVLWRANSLQETKQPTSHTIQVDWDRHIVMDLPARFLNHRCQDANVGMELVRTKRKTKMDNPASLVLPPFVGNLAYQVVAMRDIVSGEELLYDYETTEYQLAQPFACTCGSPHCRKWLHGFLHSSTCIASTYDARFIAPYLRRENFDVAHGLL